MHERGHRRRGPAPMRSRRSTAYRERFGTSPGDFPVATRLATRRRWRCPLHNAMSEDDYAYVVDTLRDL